jgi:hypothetical protein
LKDSEFLYPDDNFRVYSYEGHHKYTLPDFKKVIEEPKDQNDVKLNQKSIIIKTSENDTLYNGWSCQ